MQIGMMVTYRECPNCAGKGSRLVAIGDNERKTVSETRCGDCDGEGTFPTTQALAALAECLGAASTMAGASYVSVAGNSAPEYLSSLARQIRESALRKTVRA